MSDIKLAPEALLMTVNGRGIVIISLEELGFREKAGYWDICQKAVEKGLDFCSKKERSSDLIQTVRKAGIEMAYCPLSPVEMWNISPNIPTIFTLKSYSAGMVMRPREFELSDTWEKESKFLFTIPSER